jgi:hypothetical protein
LKANTSVKITCARYTKKHPEVFDMKIGIPGQRYSISTKNDSLENKKPSFYTGELVDEDENLIKIIDKFGVELIISKKEIIKMKLIGGVDNATYN